MQTGTGCAKDADAVIFNMGVGGGDFSWRRPEQYFVYMSQVTPINITDL
jgi:hypothetical protein